MSLFSVLVFLLAKCHSNSHCSLVIILTASVNKQRGKFVSMGVIVRDGV